MVGISLNNYCERGRRETASLLKSDEEKENSLRPNTTIFAVNFSILRIHSLHNHPGFPKIEIM